MAFCLIICDWLWSTKEWNLSFTCSFKGSLFACEKKAPSSPTLQHPWFLPYFVKCYLRSVIFGTCLLFKEGECPRDASGKFLICPTFEESPFPTDVLVLQNSFELLQEAGYPLLIVPDHIPLELKRSLKITGSATLFYAWRNRNSEEISRTQPRISRLTRWHVRWGVRIQSSIMGGFVTSLFLFTVYRLTRSLSMSDW